MDGVKLEIDGAVVEWFQKLLSNKVPELFQSQIAKLCEFVVKEDGNMLTESLRSLAKIMRSKCPDLNADKKFVKRIVSLAQSGTRKQSKYASIVLASGSYEAEVLKLMEILSTKLSDNVISQLSFLREVACFSKAIYNEFLPNVLNFVLRLVLMENNDDQSLIINESEWIEFDELPVAGQAKVNLYLKKVLGLKLMTCPLLNTADKGEELTEAAAAPVLKLLRSLLREEGELVPGNPTW